MQETPPIPGVSIRRRLAVGGMGELFLADETLAEGSTRACVVKRLLPGSGPEEQRLFLREALALRALTRLATPHVVKLYRSGPDWLLLEWVAGVDLAALLEHRRRRGRPLPLGVALAIAVGLARALEALGRAVDDAGRPLGLVHRDVHPGNLLLGNDGCVKLADLGVVALTSAPTTAGLKGTLLWMAPEQLGRGTTSPASDLYSAGLIAYEAFTGHVARPPGTLGLAELLAARSTLPIAPQVLRPELGGAIEAVLLAPLAVDPSARPTASQWLAQLLEASEPLAPDVVSLARLVAELEARPVVAPAQRTLVARAEVAMAPAPDRFLQATPEVNAAPTARPAKVRLAALVTLSLGAVVAVVSLATTPGSSELGPPAMLPPAVIEVSAATNDAIQPDALARTVSDVVAVRDTESITVLDLAPVIALDTAPVIALDTVPSQDAELPTDARIRQRDAVGAAPATSRHRVRVAAPDGPVHVRGGGMAGLAPWLSPPLPEGESLALHVTGGVRPLVAVVRVRMRKSGLTASIGAPPGEVHKVACAGRAGAETPVFGIEIDPGGVACRLEASDGRTMSFVLLDVAE